MHLLRAQVDHRLDAQLVAETFSVCQSGIVLRDLAPRISVFAKIVRVAWHTWSGRTKYQAFPYESDKQNARMLASAHYKRLCAVPVRVE